MWSVGYVQQCTIVKMTDNLDMFLSISSNYVCSYPKNMYKPTTQAQIIVGWFSFKKKLKPNKFIDWTKKKSKFDVFGWFSNYHQN